ncbi:MAG: DegT/DnrJ/EryC1/StrS family aminotransferase, partial [Lachnospiraceae bacterium]|nr:DegT/DnrJ/EryC1/StrS family aminotransferase [Lachnospiraceae bacterium]
DAAESLSATYKGRQTGSFGKYGIISFNGNKIITTSSGGMIVGNDKEDIDKARFLATQARDPARHYQHSQIGYNYRLSNVLAGIGRGQFRSLELHHNLKKKIYETYKAAFDDIPEITMNPLNPDGEANYWLSCMTIAPDCGVTPLMIMEALDAQNIESRPIWKPMQLQPVYADCDFFSHLEEGSVSEDIFNRGLCLPSDIKNTDEDMELIIRIIRGVFGR